MKPDSDVTPRARKAAWIPESYAADIFQMASRVLACWNKHVHAVGGPRVNAGDMGNTRAIKRFFGHCAKAETPFNLIDEISLCAAIRAYSADPANIAIARWKRFRVWLDPETVQAQIDRVRLCAVPSANAAEGTDHLLAERQRKTQAELFHRYAELCHGASAEGKPLRAYLRDAWERADHLSASPHLSKLDAAVARAKTGIALAHLTLIRRYDSLPSDARAQVMDQARAIFEAVQGRPPRDCDAARDLLLAICMALTERRP